MDETSFAINCANPLVIADNWLWIYSKNIVLVQNPALWISSIEWLFKYSIIAPPTCNECKPTSNFSKHEFPSPTAGMASFKTFPMLVLHTNCQGNDGTALKAQISVSWDAPFCTMSCAHDTNAFTAQHWLFPVSAWWDKFCPLFPFFWLSIVKQTRFICSPYCTSCSGMIWCLLMKNFMSHSQNCCVCLTPLPWCVYSPTQSRK